MYREINYRNIQCSSACRQMQDHNVGKCISPSETIYVSRLYFDQTEKIFLVLTGVLAIPCTSAIINLSCCETINSNRRTNSC